MSSPLLFSSQLLWETKARMLFCWSILMIVTVEKATEMNCIQISQLQIGRYQIKSFLCKKSFKGSSFLHEVQTPQPKNLPIILSLLHFLSQYCSSLVVLLHIPQYFWSKFSLYSYFPVLLFSSVQFSSGAWLYLTH